MLQEYTIVTSTIKVHVKQRLISPSIQMKFLFIISIYIMSIEKIN